jgi:hypothetical protein
MSQLYRVGRKARIIKIPGQEPLFILKAVAVSTLKDNDPQSNFCAISNFEPDANKQK